MPTQTIAELKQIALDREAARDAGIRAQADEEAKSIEMLTRLLPTVTPVGAFPFDISPWHGGKNAIYFHIPGHAVLMATFDYNRHDGTWTQRSIDDTRAKWRVRAFDRIDWDGEDECYRPNYRSEDFGDLGEALLAAERAFVDPAQIEQQVSQANATKATAYPETQTPPTLEQVVSDMRKDLGNAEWGAPEHGAAMFSQFIDKYYRMLGIAISAPVPTLTTEEKLLSVLKDFVLEYASQTRDEFA